MNFMNKVVVSLFYTTTIIETNSFKIIWAIFICQEYFIFWQKKRLFCVDCINLLFLLWTFGTFFSLFM